MRVFDNGCYYTVTVTAREVIDFADRWPCSGLESRSLTVQFDKRNGDLVDSDDERNHPDADGGALRALIDDARTYGATKLGVK